MNRRRATNIKLLAILVGYLVLLVAHTGWVATVYVREGELPAVAILTTLALMMLGWAGCKLIDKVDQLR